MFLFILSTCDMGKRRALPLCLLVPANPCRSEANRIPARPCECTWEDQDSYLCEWLTEQGCDVHDFCESEGRLLDGGRMQPWRDLPYRCRLQVWIDHSDDLGKEPCRMRWCAVDDTDTEIDSGNLSCFFGDGTTCLPAY